MFETEEWGIVKDKFEQTLQIYIMANIINDSINSKEFILRDIADEKDKAEVFWINFFSPQIWSLIDSVEKTIEKFKKENHDSKLLLFLNSVRLKDFLYKLAESLQTFRIYSLIEFDETLLKSTEIFNQCEKSEKANIKSFTYIRKLGKDCHSF